MKENKESWLLFSPASGKKYHRIQPMVFQGNSRKTGEQCLGEVQFVEDINSLLNDAVEISLISIVTTLEIRGIPREA